MSATKIVPEQLQADLEQFDGTEEYHRLTLNRRLVATDGVKYLCEAAEAFWLVDAIGSYQPRCARDPMLRRMQFWKLTVDLEKHDGKLTCERDAGDVVITQRIPYTDFPLASIRIWVEAGDDLMVAMLPGER